MKVEDEFVETRLLIHSLDGKCLTECDGCCIVEPILPSITTSPALRVAVHHTNSL